MSCTLFAFMGFMVDMCFLWAFLSLICDICGSLIFYFKVLFEGIAVYTIITFLCYLAKFSNFEYSPSNFKRTIPVFPFMF